MPWTECQLHMPVVKVSVLLGDVNCHPNIHASRLLTERRQELLAICLQHDLSWITHTSDFKHDHVLLDSSLSTTVTTHHLISPKTDHTLLSFRLPPRPPQLTSTSQTIRLNLKYLDDPQLADQLISSFEQLWKDYGNLIHFLSQQIMHAQDRPTTQDLINTMYTIYTSLISTCCEATLGTYHPHQQQNQIDNSIPFLRLSMAHDHAVQLFKRSQRRNRKPLTSDDPSLPQWKAQLDSTIAFTTLQTLIASNPFITSAKPILYRPIHYFSSVRLLKSATTL